MSQKLEDLEEPVGDSNDIVIHEEEEDDDFTFHGDIEKLEEELMEYSVLTDEEAKNVPDFSDLKENEFILGVKYCLRGMKFSFKNFLFPLFVVPCSITAIFNSAMISIMLTLTTGLLFLLLVFLYYAFQMETEEGGTFSYVTFFLLTLPSHQFRWSQCNGLFSVFLSNFDLLIGKKFNIMDYVNQEGTIYYVLLSVVLILILIPMTIIFFQVLYNVIYCDAVVKLTRKTKSLIMTERSGNLLFGKGGMFEFSVTDCLPSFIKFFLIYTFFGLIELLVLIIITQIPVVGALSFYVILIPYSGFQAFKVIFIIEKSYFQCYSFCAKRFYLVLGFGVVIAICTLIPLFGFVTHYCGVVGATIYYYHYDHYIQKGKAINN